MRAFFLFVVLVTASPAAAQSSVEAMLERLNNVDPAVTTEADCERQVAQAATLNALDLLYGASVCFAVRRPLEGSFLLNAGQMRSFADMPLMIPAARADADIITSLYGVIYFHAGGPGDESVLRDPASRERFFSLLDRWSPEFPADHNPGWNTRRRPEGAAYQAHMAEVKAARRQQLVTIAAL